MNAGVDTLGDRSTTRSLIETRRRDAENLRLERIRKLKYSVASSRIPVVHYHPKEYAENTATLPLFSEEDRELKQLQSEFSELSHKILHSENRDRPVLDSTTGIRRVYGDASPMSTQTAIRRSEGDLPNVHTVSRSRILPIAKSRTTRSKNMTLGYSEINQGAEDPLFDFIMQREGMSASLEREDEELVTYLEEKLYSQRRRSLREEVHTKPTQKTTRSLRSQKFEMHEEPSFILSSLYTRKIVDFDRKDRVNELQKEVQDLQESLKRFEVPATANSASDADLSGAGNTIFDNVGNSSAEEYHSKAKDASLTQNNLQVNSDAGERTQRADIAASNDEATKSSSSFDSDGDENDTEP